MYQFNVIWIVKIHLKSYLAQGKAKTRNHTDYIFVFSTLKSKLQILCKNLAHFPTEINPKSSTGFHRTGSEPTYPTEPTVHVLLKNPTVENAKHVQDKPSAADCLQNITKDLKLKPKHPLTSSVLLKHAYLHLMAAILSHSSY